MKIVLVFLLVTVVIRPTHQQFPDLPDGRVWYSPWISPYLRHSMLDDSYNPEMNQNILESKANFRFRGPVRYPSPFYSQGTSFNPYLVGLDNQDNSFIGNYLQDFRQPYGVVPYSNNARFFFGSGFGNGNTNIVRGGLRRTTIVVSTSIVTTAFVQSCIPIGQFAAAANPVPPACRRRRDNAPNQFTDISPSEVEKVLPTDLPSIELFPESRQWSTELDSSKLQFEESSRDKRFFNVFLVTSTSTSYAFVPSTVRVTVYPAGAAAAVPGPLICMPKGYVLC